MSTTCTKNSDARTAKNPQSWTIESNLSRHCKKTCRWFLNEFDMRANSRRGALLPTMSVTVSMTNETPKCFICLPGAHRNVPSVRSLAWNDFLVCGKQLPCQKISAFDAQEAAFSSIPALEPSSERWRWGLGCHTSRRQALGEKTQNTCNGFFVILKQQRRWHGLASEAFTPLRHQLAHHLYFVSLEYVWLTDWANDVYYATIAGDCSVPASHTIHTRGLGPREKKKKLRLNFFFKLLWVNLVGYSCLLLTVG